MANDSAVVVFDDERAVANAGVVLPAVLAVRLGIEALVDEHVELGERLVITCQTSGLNGSMPTCRSERPTRRGAFLRGGRCRARPGR